MLLLQVLFCDINVEKGRATEAELQEQYGVDVVFFHPADVSDDKQHKGQHKTFTKDTSLTLFRKPKIQLLLILLVGGIRIMSSYLT